MYNRLRLSNSTIPSWSSKNHTVSRLLLYLNLQFYVNERITTDVASLDASNHPRTRKSSSDNSFHLDTKPPSYDSPVIPQPILLYIVECIDNSTTQNCNYIHKLLSN